MAFTKMNCESCGAELALPQGKSSMKCGFCGTLNKPAFDEPGSAPNPAKTLMLNAVESDNWEEVAKYSVTILETDPSDYEAWFYKGAAAGWNSRHIDDPSKEIINCFRNAFANSKDEDTSDVLTLFGTKGSDLLEALANGSRGFAQEHGCNHPEIGGWDEDTMGGHILKILGFIEASYTLTEINRNDRVEHLNANIDALFLRLYAFLHTKIRFENAVMSKNPFQGGVGLDMTYHAESEWGLKWEPRVDEILKTNGTGGYGTPEELLKDPVLAMTLLSDPREGNDSEGGGGCFVATVVYGGEDHVNLIVLRSFRDNFLEKYALGRRFIALYYKHGPKLAKKVADSELLRSLFTPLVGLGVFIVKLFRLG